MTQDRFDRARFKHKIEIRVRNYEVDWQGIVHNAVYLLYFEVGRVEYLKNVGAELDLNSVRGDNKVVLVHNEIDYMRPVHFDDLLIVRTRISSIKKSSFLMEGLLELAAGGELVATNVAHHVWLDPATNRPTPVRDEFRKLIQRYEGGEGNITWPVRET